MVSFLFLEIFFSYILRLLFPVGLLGSEQIQFLGSVEDLDILQGASLEELLDFLFVLLVAHVQVPGGFVRDVVAARATRIVE